MPCFEDIDHNDDFYSHYDPDEIEAWWNQPLPKTSRVTDDWLLNTIDHDSTLQDPTPTQLLPTGSSSYPTDSFSSHLSTPNRAMVRCPTSRASSSSLANNTTKPHLAPRTTLPLSSDPEPLAPRTDNNRTIESHDGNTCEPTQRVMYAQTNQYQSPFIVRGNQTAHHSAWGLPTSNPSGETQKDFLRHDLFILIYSTTSQHTTPLPERHKHSSDRYNPLPDQQKLLPVRHKYSYNQNKLLSNRNKLLPVRHKYSHNQHKLLSNRDKLLSDRHKPLPERHKPLPERHWTVSRPRTTKTENKNHSSLLGHRLIQRQGRNPRPVTAFLSNTDHSYCRTPSVSQTQ